MYGMRRMLLTIFAAAMSGEVAAADGFMPSDHDGEHEFGRSWSYMKKKCHIFSSEEARLTECLKVALLEISSMEQAAGGADAFYAKEEAETKEREAKDKARETANADPKLMQVAWSAKLCAAKKDQRWASAEMQRYRKATAALGIRNQRKEDGLSRVSVEASESERRALSSLKENNSKALPCSNSMVSKVAICLAYSDDRDCSDAAQRYVDALPDD